jgi:hypothetical protein
MHVAELGLDLQSNSIYQTRHANSYHLDSDDVHPVIDVVSDL